MKNDKKTTGSIPHPQNPHHIDDYRVGDAPALVSNSRAFRELHAAMQTFSSAESRLNDITRMAKEGNETAIGDLRDARHDFQDAIAELDINLFHRIYDGMKNRLLATRQIMRDEELAECRVWESKGSGFAGSTRLFKAEIMGKNLLKYDTDWDGWLALAESGDYYTPEQEAAAHDEADMTLKYAKQAGVETALLEQFRRGAWCAKMNQLLGRRFDASLHSLKSDYDAMKSDNGGAE